MVIIQGDHGIEYASYRKKCKKMRTRFLEHPVDGDYFSRLSITEHRIDKLQPMHTGTAHISIGQVL